jgi:uncharacterized protein (UPF0335 family)
MSDVFDEDDIPAFLKADRDVNKIVDDLGDEDDDFDFPSLDEDEDEDDDLGLPDDPIAEEPQPEPEPVAEPAPKAKAKAKAKDKPAEEPKTEEPENKRARPGNNSGVEAGPLRSFIERIERLEEDRKSIGDDIKDVKAEAKGTGYDVKAINRLLKKRKQDKAERDEQEALDHLYMFALGME